MPDPAAPSPDPASAPAGDAAPAADAGGAPAGAATETPSAAPAQAPAAEPAPAADAPPAAAAPAQPAAKPRDLTARLSALSRENREAAKAKREADARAAAAEAKATDFEALLTKAAKDPAAMDALFQRAGLTFDAIVNRYAEQPAAELTPEQKTAAAVEELRKDLQAEKDARAKEAKEAADRQAQASRAETIAGISQAIAKQADKYEICARLGDEAANDVLGVVVKAWNDAGKPELMPGEFEEAVQAAIEQKELEYENRGKKLSKQARANAAAPAATAPGAATAKTGLAPKEDPLPKGLLPTSRLTDTDEDILRGLTDKTAPATESQRAKPRTINSSLGGSAPPRTPARGALDPREALREVLAPYQRQ